MNENAKRFLKLVSVKDSGWLAKAKWRQKNEKLLDLIFAIKVKILRANKRIK